MQIDALTSPTERSYLPFIARNVNEARRLLSEATGLLAQPTLHGAATKQAASAAGNAAEHLYDLSQVDDPVEGLREALVAADALAGFAQDLGDNAGNPSFDGGHIATQLTGIDRTLASIEAALGLHHDA